MTSRERKGIEIARTLKITHNGECWLVPSQTRRKKRYRVHFGPAYSCDCEDFQLQQQWCKHLFAVKHYLQREHGAEYPEVEEAKQKRPTYTQQWGAYNKAQVAEKPLFQSLLKELCKSLVTAVPGRNGGRHRISLSDMVFASVFKVYSTLPSRRFISDLIEAQAKGHVTVVPHFNSVLGYIADPALTSILTKLIWASATPLKSVERKFAADSSGFSTCRHVRWFDKKHGKDRDKEDDEHRWVTAHIMCGTTTNVVTAVEVTPPHFNESPRLPKLLKQTAKRFDIGVLCADKGFLSNKNVEEVVGLGAIPYIPFKSNSTSGVAGSVWENLFHLYTEYRDEFLKHYHARSNAESTFMMIKTKFGAAVRARTEAGMKNEVLCKILCHNLCCVIHSMYELGIEPTFET